MWAEKDPDHVLDDGVGIGDGTHKVTVRDLLRKTKLYWLTVQPDGWAAADGSVQNTGSNYNYAGANSNRVAYQDGWGFPPDETINSPRSAEHTSELHSRQYLVCRLLL